MSSLMDTLGQYLGNDAVRQISSQIGADEQTTQSALAAALPMILGAVTKEASSQEGAEKLYGAIERDHDGGLLDDLSGLAGAGDSQGAGILGHIFGGKQERVATGLSKSTGLDSASSDKLMKMLAPMVLGAIGKQQRQQGLNAGGLSDLMGKERQELEQRAPQQMSMVGKLLDTDGDGDFDMSDMLAHGTKLLGGFFKS